MSIKELISEYAAYNKFSVQLSIDAGPKCKTNRCPDSKREWYEASIKKSVDFLIGANIRFSIRGTLCSEMAGDLYSNYNYFVEIYEDSESMQPNVMFSPELYKSNWRERDLIILEENIDNIVRDVAAANTENGEDISESFVRKALQNLKRKKTNEPPAGHNLCGFSRELYAIAPNGDAYACHRVYNNDDLWFGNMLTGDIDFAKLNAIASVFNNREFVQPNSKIGIANCTECAIRWSCGSVCPANNTRRYAENGSIECDYVMYRMRLAYARSVERHFSTVIREDNKTPSMST